MLATLLAMTFAGWRLDVTEHGSLQRVVRLPARLVPAAIHLWRIPYRAAAGPVRHAFVAVPAWYGRHHDPALPLIISPHGRGVPALGDCESWGKLPAIGRFIVACPQGQGAHLGRYSWGAPQQIDDLARLPEIVRQHLPWLHIQHHRIYAVGGSMGGQETLLLLAQHPRLLAGAIAFDSVTDFSRQYRDFTALRCDAACRSLNHGPLGRRLQTLAQREVGGTPSTDPRGYLIRSPLHYARQLAFSGVPLELWWSTSDLVVTHQQIDQTGALFRAMRRLNPTAPVEAFVGAWIHSHEERATSRLPFALAQLGLLPTRFLHRPSRLHEHHFIPRRLLTTVRQPGERGWARRPLTRTAG